MVSAVVVRGFDGHRERFMITGICYGFAPVGAAWSVGVLLVGAGPVGLVEHRPRRPEAAHSLSLDRAAGITRPIESALTLMPPGMLRGPEAAAARSARCTWVCVDVHTECASPETHLKANVNRRLRRAVANCEQPTEQPTYWAITDPCRRPRTWTRSAITRRTPRLRLVIRRSRVRFSEAAPSFELASGTFQVSAIGGGVTISFVCPRDVPEPRLCSSGSCLTIGFR